jgi:hypothetical protein
MNTVIRTYTGAPTLADDLKKRTADIQKEIGSVKGFTAYYLVKTTDGAASITVCEDRGGCEESSKRAANWLRTNMPNLKMAPPQVISGEVHIQFASHPAKV